MFAVPQQFVTIFCLALNALSSISIVICNKWLFQDYYFVYSITLTLIHFVMTFLGLVLCLGGGMFKLKRVSIMKVLPLSISFCGFVVLTNMSLVYNSVGFYQLIKVLTTPMLVVMETLIYKKTFSTKIKLSLLLICVGVTIATVTDSELNFVGTVVAFSALFVTCQYQIWVGTKQKELDCDSFQLLLYQAPISSVFLLPIAYFTEIQGMIEPCNEVIKLILLTGVIAFLVNISIFLVIRKTSPVTYNVLGHFKLCVILILGTILFGDSMDAKRIVGVVMTLAGVFWYTHLKTATTANAEFVTVDKAVKEEEDGSNGV
ncbi:solute carrier family 35, member E3 [Trypanosoma rangeli]|uniref:Solute carrier family 35, member E3 n=1 Tax=Trypanosoma rangeli TaxID=5698 RepID=A0A422NUS0_TRYRA|nr:solute carrier family 35, member E3 [Trypanosoma rangeli]RNF09194.1 solute carrier family 35, member E3 [Trypanosoma rangeli]|eukprot:RNF09194.1 solute carrier family 35, member E3 [Trypanosoma rangeli]